MIETRRWLIVPTIMSASALAFACSSSSSNGDDSNTCATGSCSESDSGGSDATLTDGGTAPSDASTPSDGAVTVGGPPIVLGQHLKTPYSLTVDATYVYIAEDVSPGARVLRAPIAGGTMETLATGFAPASAIAVDATNVYVGEGSTGYIYEFPLAGSPDGGVPPHFLAGSQDVGSMAINATHLYWGTGDYGHAIFSYEFGTDAAAPPTVFGGAYDQGISIDSTDMFWGQQYLGSVSTRSLAPDAAPQVDLVKAQSVEGVDNQMTEVRPLAGTIYWGQETAAGSGIYSLPSTPQLPPVSPKLLVTDPNVPWHLNVDEKYVYWLSLAAVCPGIQYVPLAGGTTKILVPAPDDTIFSFTQDANYIYYTHGTDSGDATLVRITKPS